MLKWKGRALSTACACCIEPLAATGVSRRQFVAGAAAAGLAATGFAPKVFAQAKPHRIDVHAPCRAADLARRHGRDRPQGLSAGELVGRRRRSRTWTRAASPPRSCRRPRRRSRRSARRPRSAIAREANEYAKKLEADHPGRFGMFAMLPLPHIDESLKEIAYAFDTLKVDGVGMMTNYGDKWLGYPVLRAGLGGAQPPQGDGLHPSDRRQLLRQSGAGRAAVGDRVGHRHHAHDRQPDLQRHVAEVQGHQLDLVARRRRADRRSPSGS